MIGQSLTNSMPQTSCDNLLVLEKTNENYKQINSTLYFNNKVSNSKNNKIIKQVKMMQLTRQVK